MPAALRLMPVMMPWTKPSTGMAPRATAMMLLAGRCQVSCALPAGVTAANSPVTVWDWDHHLESIDWDRLRWW